MKDYTELIDCLKSYIRRLSKSHKDELVTLGDKDEDMSEYTDLEKLGSDPTFDPRIGNKYTRKLHIKEIYNNYYYENYD